MYTSYAKNISCVNNTLAGVSPVVFHRYGRVHPYRCIGPWRQNHPGHSQLIQAIHPITRRMLVSFKFCKQDISCSYLQSIIVCRQEHDFYNTCTYIQHKITAAYFRSFSRFFIQKPESTRKKPLCSLVKCKVFVHFTQPISGINV